MITDLMGDDSMCKLEPAHVGNCPACKNRRTLYRITIGKEIIYVCFDCFKSAIKLIALKRDYK